ncbi:Pentatricopeptide repeat-containing protein [Drosera capensis]
MDYLFGIGFKHGRALHAHVLKFLGFNYDPYVQASLVNFYSKCGKFGISQFLFDQIRDPDLATWNIMLAAHSRSGSSSDATSVDGFGSAEDAETSMKVLDLFRNMQSTSVVRPNEVTLVALASACASLGALSQAHGHGHRALDLFERMKQEGLTPDDVTLAVAISACSHVGLVEEGRNIFDSMENDYEVKPKLEHYCCLVDLLGRAGRLEEAEERVKSMPMSTNTVLWRSLLGAAKLHGNSTLGETAIKHLIELEPDNSGNYVLLSNLYSRIEKWDYANEVRRLMKCKGVDKIPEWETEVIQGQVEIYLKLEEVDSKLREHGHTPSTKEVLFDIEEEEKEDALSYHLRSCCSGSDCFCPHHEEPAALMVTTPTHPLFNLHRALSPILAAPHHHLLQCNRRIRDLSRQGRISEARQLFDEMPQRDPITWNAMISAYTRNNQMGNAQLLFDAAEVKDVRTWTSLLTGYSKGGRVDEARRVFECMPERNVVSWNAMVSGLVENGRLRCARKVFDEMPERDVASWNGMVTGYCHGSMMKEAMELFDRMPERNLVSWFVVMNGFVKIDCFEEAWDVFEMMRKGGVLADQEVIVAALLAVKGLNELDLIESLRGVVIKIGFEEDVVVGTAILNAYTGYGAIDTALCFFERMPEKNEYSWSSMITSFSQCGRLDDAVALYRRVPERTVATRTTMMTAYAQNGRIREAELIFYQIPNPSTITWNAMISGYASEGMIKEANDLFMRMPARNSTSWAAMIAGFVQNGQGEEALQFFADLLRSGDLPNHSCLTSSLFVCSNVGAIKIGKQIHALTVKIASWNNSFVGNGLISMYSKGKHMEDATRVFNSMGVKDIVSWNSLITGLVENEMLAGASDTFNKMPRHDVVSWTALMSGFTHSGQVDIALRTFLDMMAEGLRPTESTITTVVSACAGFGSVKLGEQIHGLVLKLGFDERLFVCNALISMYSKCGSEVGLCIFHDMSHRDIVSWNAALAGCAHNGLGKEAVELFRSMEAEAIFPNEFTFLELLCACSRSGLVDDAWTYFNSMQDVYGIKPLVFHYTCMVDLLGRFGKLSEAEALINSMTVEPDSVIWEALLGACRIHNNVELAKEVAENLFQMGTHKPGMYVLLSNLYASDGRWDEVRDLRDSMKVHKVSKEPGFSWIQIKNKIHSFSIADRAHDRIEDIYALLKDYQERLKMMGYVPDTNFVLHDVEEEQKEDELLYHCEKLALAFGILSTPKETCIHVMKNLRTCVAETIGNQGASVSTAWILTLT